MAEVAFTFAPIGHGLVKYTWASLANGDTGAWVDMGRYIEANVQVYGTFGSGGNCQMQGTNESGTPSNPYTANDPQGNPLNIGTAKGEQVLEGPDRVRPSITAGDGTTDLTVIMRVKGGR